MQKDTVQSLAGLNDESQLVTFLLNEEEFAFDIMSVQEIIRLPRMAKVPRTPAYVDGIANLRGVVLPVIDVRTRFGMERKEETDRTRVLVVDLKGVKTGMRVDRVMQVVRVQRSEIEAPSAAIRGTSSAYLEGVVKLDQGRRIVMSLNASRICDISLAPADAVSASDSTPHGPSLATGFSPTREVDTATAIKKLVTFRIAREEYGVPLEDVREILRVQTPKQVPDVPDYVLGVLTVRGQILPVIDLRRLLQQPTLAREFNEGCRGVRMQYEQWIAQAGKAGVETLKMDMSAPGHLRAWLAGTNCASQSLMETLSTARGWNEKVFKQLQAQNPEVARDQAGGTRASTESILACSQQVLSALLAFEQQIGTNIQEDQRIIVVDAGGTVLGLVVDHVHEVLNIPQNLVERVPMFASVGGLELSGVAKLEDGSRLIMLLDVSSLMKEQKLQTLDFCPDSKGELSPVVAVSKTAGGQHHLDETQLVTFMLGDEEFGVPISQIQEIDRLGKITRVPRTASFIEGVTNLRGEVIPVLDTRKRFDLPVKPADDRTRVIIVNLGGVRTGLIVDSVRQVLNLATRDIAPPPEAISSGVGHHFISGIGKIDDGRRMIVLLDVVSILSSEEHAELVHLHKKDHEATATGVSEVHQDV